MDEVWFGGKQKPNCIDENDRTEFSWEWTTGDVWSYTNWGDSPYQPNNCSHERTLLIGGSHEWDDGDSGNSLNWAVFAVDVPLPIEFNLFKAIETQPKGVQLIWQTTSETNNKGFHIERSFDGVVWYEMGFVSGAGIRTGLNEYSYFDQSPNEGDNYYRLRQEDFDGATDYSSIISINIQKDVSGFNLPKPKRWNNLLCRLLF